MTVLVLNRLVFCSRYCLQSALAYWCEFEVRKLRIGTAIARTIKCYCCDLFLDETKG